MIHKKSSKLLTIFSFIIFIFLFFPLFLIVITSFGKNSSIQIPPVGFSFKWYVNIFHQPMFIAGFRMSLIIALLSSVLALVIGIPAVYGLIRSKVHHYSWFQSFFLSPTLIPEIVIGFSIYQALVIKLHIPMFFGLLCGHLMLGLPYVIRLVTSGILLLDQNIEEAAQIYGCSKLESFMKIILPNISINIIGAFMMCFINSFNNIPISLFLNNSEIHMLPTAILNYLQNNYDPTVSAISVILMIFTTIVTFIIDRFTNIVNTK